jgi:multiple sugar transport system substrate-binding protein
VLRITLSILAAALLTVTAYAQAELTVWTHQTGDAEMDYKFGAVERFNASQDQWRVVLNSIPAGGYSEAVTAAALANDLPCVLDADQPLIPNFAWAGYLRPLDGIVPQATIDATIPGGRGTYRGETYGLGQFDVALTIFARRSVLDEHGIRVPTVEAPWTVEEFEAALASLEAGGEFDHALVIDGFGGSHFTYGLSPFFQSAGADLIDRDTYLTAEGALNGPAAIRAAEWLRSLADDGYADPAPVDPFGFSEGRNALFYTGSWWMADLLDLYGDDLLYLPSVDLGHGAKIGAASWQWTVSSTCEHPEGAGAFIDFVMSDAEIAAFSDVTGLIPTTEGGAEMSKLYASGEPYRLLFDYAQAGAVRRPETPAYLTIEAEFDRAMRRIMEGADAQDALDDAVDAIDRDIQDNAGYGF